MPSKWPEELERFIKTEKWTFAKTYAQTWPHEYLVKERVDEGMFLDIILNALPPDVVYSPYLDY